MNLLLLIYHLGLVNGLKYWRLNRHYSKYPEDLQKCLLKLAAKKAILEPHFPWSDFADQCQKSLHKYKLTK